jgi:flagellar hook assembly protein FlgD
VKRIDDTVEVGFSPNGDGTNETWNASFDMSKPVDWTLTVKDGNGKVVRRLSGEGPVGSIRLVWNGKDDGGRRVASGKLTWTLRANARDGIGKLTSQGDLILVR